MRYIDGRLILSATDLTGFMGCAHRTALDLAHLDGTGPAPRTDGAEAALVQAYGNAHEADYRAGLEDVVEIAEDGSVASRIEATRMAMREGPGIIYQAALFGNGWGGFADFLERVERPSALGAFSYEVTDTKLKRSAHPVHVLQLALYSDLLADMQGIAPEHAHVQLGDGERATLRLADYAAYSRRARRRLETFVAERRTTHPEPCAACDLCRWHAHCAGIWDRTDSLALVAGMTRGQRAKCEAAGVTTMAALARREGRIAALAEPTRAKLRRQAALQGARRAGGPPRFVLREAEPGRGFAKLPAPDPGDLFYDIEGDPYFDGGLEYLHGIRHREDGRTVFRDFWAHDHAEERDSLRALMAFFSAHLKAHPNAHVYHYAPYEVTALRRLTTKYGIGEALLDEMLRKGRLVDLYAVVSGALIASEPAYSLKNLEVFYMEAREGDVVTAGGSVVAYERWRETGDAAILREIRDYNEVDCLSTELLRDWLVRDVRPADARWRAPEDLATDRIGEEDGEADALRARLATLGDDRLATLLFDLGAFHAREKKPVWWSIFDKLDTESEELVDDLECLALCEAVGPEEPAKSLVQRWYRYPAQETKLKTGVRAGPCLKPFDGPAPVYLLEHDPEARQVLLKFPRKVPAAPDRLDLLPAPPIGTDPMEASLARLTERMIAGEDCGAVGAFLRREPPAFRDGARARVVDPARDIVESATAAIAALDRGVLPIQGPPGTGKTFTSSHAIRALVEAGQRVAVCAHGHAAIDNLLLACVSRGQETGRRFPIAKKISFEEQVPEDDTRAPLVWWTRQNDDSALFEAAVVGGTSWLFSRPEFEGTFDTLFVDEAGQMSAANLAAIGACARNIVLVGDPLQLPQPLQGAHPGGSGASALEYLLREERTVDPARGIFLPLSRRMHPAVCAFISEQVYDGRLDSHPDTARQSIAGRASGAFLVPVAHEGNAQSSGEEIDAIGAEIGALLGMPFTDAKGETRPLALSDILVVAPYNAQVNALRAALPPGARIGTVDKFQGQEAPVCLVSMTTSSADELPRNMEFLFSLNRINVAISRAMALALVFVSPRLLDAPCATVEQMKLVNTVCALPERGAGAASLSAEVA